MRTAIEHRSKQPRKNFWGLRGFNLQLDPGVIGFLGPNGVSRPVSSL
jgi:hypothetical protein